MLNFKIGQRVRRTQKGITGVPIGAIGTVVFVYEDGGIDVNINDKIWKRLWGYCFGLVGQTPTRGQRWTISKNRVETRHLRKKNGQ